MEKLSKLDIILVILTIAMFSCKKEVTPDITAEPPSSIFLIYKYENATANNTEYGITLYSENLNEASFVVPEREHFIFNGWYLGSDFSIPVTDEFGNLVIGIEIFNSNTSFIFAKWTGMAEPTFKILMVFIPELEGYFGNIAGDKIYVNYKMSAIERHICELIVSTMSSYLNDWFAGVVNFEVDYYFTTVSSETYMVDDIPEVKHLLNNYRSVITSYCMNDYEWLINYAGGTGWEQRAMISLEAMWGSLVTQQIPLEMLLLEDWSEWWKYFIDSYLHEFAHSVEYGQTKLGGVGYHGVLTYYRREFPNPNLYNYLEATKLYFLNEFIMDGKKIGIPLQFWKNGF